MTFDTDYSDLKNSFFYWNYLKIQIYSNLKLFTDVIIVHLPRDASENQQKPVINVKPVVLRIDMSDPVHFHGTQWLDGVIGPGEGYAHPQAYEDAEQLDDVGVGDGVEAAEQGVEDGHASAEDDGSAVVHVNYYSQSCTWGQRVDQTLW